MSMLAGSPHEMKGVKGDETGGKRCTGFWRRAKPATSSEASTHINDVQPFIYHKLILYSSILFFEDEMGGCRSMKMLSTARSWEPRRQHDVSTLHDDSERMKHHA